MKRDMDMIRDILAHAEAHAVGDALRAPELCGTSDDLLHYHLELCEQAGYLRIKKSGYNPEGQDHYAIVNLTWQGHEMLERLRNGG